MTAEERRRVIASLERDLAGYRFAAVASGSPIGPFILRLERAIADQRERALSESPR